MKKGKRVQASKDLDLDLLAHFTDALVAAPLRASLRTWPFIEYVPYYVSLWHPLGRIACVFLGHRWRFYGGWEPKEKTCSVQECGRCGRAEWINDHPKPSHNYATTTSGILYFSEEECAKAKHGHQCACY